MNKRHQRTLNSIFAQPISGNIKWRDVESLLKNLGAVLNERTGSRVAVRLGRRVAFFTVRIQVRIWIKEQSEI